MMSFWTNLIAQTGPPAPGPTSGQGAPSSGMTFLLPALMIGMVVFMLLTSRSQKKREKKQREQMFAGMSKNKRVETIGGIIGTIVNVKENEIVLKVDESTNAKMTFVKTAVRRVIDDDVKAVGS